MGMVVYATDLNITSAQQSQRQHSFHQSLKSLKSRVRDVQMFEVFERGMKKKREMKLKIILTRKVCGEERINEA